MNNPISISKKILEYASRKGLSLTHLQLQKLLYFVYGYHLAVFGKSLFFSGFSPWTYGPVSDEAYHFFKRYGSNVIPYDDDVLNHIPAHVGPEENLSISKVVDAIGHLQAAQLVELSHAEPWLDAVNRRSSRIDDNLIAEHFRKNFIQRSHV